MANVVRSLRDLDLNLLVSADVFLRETSVARAARLLGITQPAASQRLARLRDMFDDPLLVRRGGRMVRTSAGDELRSPIERVLAEIRAVVERRPAFEPGTARRSFVLATTDYPATVLLPDLASRLLGAAPHVGLDVRFVDSARYEADLDRGHDLAVGVLPPRAGVARRVLFRETMLCLVRARHPFLKRSTLQRYAGYPHIVMSPSVGGRNPVDDALARSGLTRNVLLRVAGFGMAPAVLAATDAIMTLPARLARHYASRDGLATCAPPVEIAPFEIHVAWSARNEGDPALAWLVDQLVKSASAS